MTEGGAPSKAVALLSGGLDSSVLLHHLRQCLGVAEVHALSFDYGQRHSIELRCAAAQAQAARVRHVVIPMSFLGPLLAPGSTLLAAGGAVPDLAEIPGEDLSQPPTYVPHRNLMLLSLAAAYAEANGIQAIYYGAQAQDEYGYWDCTTTFLERVNETLSLNHRQAVRVHAPFVASSKADNVREGHALGVDFSQTWTCYRGSEATPPVACGKCPSCVERLKAFAAAGLPDPLPYL